MFACENFPILPPPVKKIVVAPLKVRWRLPLRMVIPFLRLAKIAARSLCIV